MRPPSLRLDLAAVHHNVRCWVDYLAPRELWAVVKANAYGLGLVRVARACLEAGARRLCVVDVDEARTLRAAGIDAPVVHVQATAADEMEEALRLNVIASIEDESGARAMSKGVARTHSRVASIGQAQSAHAHIAIETGTGWCGVPAQRAAKFARAVRALPGIGWEGAWTHVAGRETLAAQRARFDDAVAALRAEGLAVPVVHTASTGPALWGGAAGDAMRIGIGLYGSTLGLPPPPNLPLRTALEVKASVIAIKTFERETPLGYAGKYVASAGDRVATLRVGYADGLPTELVGKGTVLLSGRSCPIVGAIGMNFTMVALPAGTGAAVGDEAVLLSLAGGPGLDAVAGAASVIPHVLVTSLARGMPLQVVS